MRVLHIFSNPHLTNGASIFEYRLSEFLKDDEIYFDYLVTETATPEEQERYQKNGSNLYQIPLDQKHGLLIRELKANYEYYKFFKTHPYKIVYADTENSLRAIHLLMARLAGIKVRVVHSHNTGLQTVSKKSKKIARLLRKFFLLSATDYFACSDAAAEWLFPKKIYRSKQYTIANNGINIEKFRYNQADRIKIRGKHHVSEDTIVVGAVGRFMEQKNHKFMLEVFKTFHEERKNSVLFLVGEGKLEDTVRTQVKKLQLEHSVIFCGTTTYVEQYLSAMDIYIMPSIFEGLGIAAIEAQANGLPCLLSDQVPAVVKMSKNVVFESLHNTTKKWSDQLEKFINKRTDGTENTKEIIAKGYSIKNTVRLMKEFYLAEERK